jgi:broad specificity phosphatase PhoE
VSWQRSKEQASGANSHAPLTEAGQRRARALATVLQDAGLTAIDVSEFQRTRQTAEPLAQALQIDPRLSPGRSLYYT